MAEEFDPYRKWLGIPAGERPPNHYRLLGLELFESDADAIANAADRQMGHVRTFQTGQHAALSQQVLNELSAARLCLLSAEKKAEYDAQLLRGLEVRQTMGGAPPIPPVIRQGLEDPLESIVAAATATPSGGLPAALRRARAVPLHLLLVAAGALVTVLVAGVVWLATHPGPEGQEANPASREGAAADEHGARAGSEEQQANSPPKTPNSQATSPPRSKPSSVRPHLSSSPPLATTEGKRPKAAKASLQAAVAAPNPFDAEGDAPGPAIGSADSHSGMESSKTVDHPALPGPDTGAPGNSSGSARGTGSDLPTEPLVGSMQDVPNPPATHGPKPSGVTPKQPEKAEAEKDESPEEPLHPAVQGLACRKEAHRAALLKAYGGTPETEAALKRALGWLAEHQFPNGNWSFDHNTPRCAGQCSGAGTQAAMVNAATALPLLAFLGTGQNSRQGEYRRNIALGLQVLKIRMRQVTPIAGSLADNSGLGISSHALATMALCEAVLGPRDKAGRLPAQAAVNFIVMLQNADGGWGYYQNTSAAEKTPVASDLESTAWNIAALRSAQWAGLQVPPQTLQRAGQFLDSVESKDAASGAVRFASRPSDAGNTSPFNLPIGLYSRMCLGWGRSRPELQAGVERLGENGSLLDGPAESKYFNSLLLRNFGGPPWHAWNTALREQLLSQQAKEGHAAGSWYFATGQSTIQYGGRLYCTALSALMLEVYYRYPPPAP